MSYIRAWMSLKLGQIPPRTTELAALERLKLDVATFFSVAMYLTHFRFVGIENMNNLG